MFHVILSGCHPRHRSLATVLKNLFYIFAHVCFIYIPFLSLPSPISHSSIIFLFSSFSYGILLILIIFFHTYCTYLFAPGNHRTNGKGSSPFSLLLAAGKKPGRLRNNYTRSKLLEMLDNEGFANQYNFVQLGLKHELKSFKVADLSPKYIFGNATDCT